MEPSSPLNNSNNVYVSETKHAQSNNTEYKEIISNLPQKDSWYPSVKLHNYQGFWCNADILERIMSAQEHFIAQPTDIIICSIPKSGMTWLKALCYAITRRTHLSDSFTNRLLTELPHDIVPFVDSPPQKAGVEAPNNLPLWATHVPYHSLPKSIAESRCKIIYVCRNPKDVLISLWHFSARVRGTSAEAFPLEEAFQKFCEGVTTYGPYWDHILGYWKASLQSPERILVIKYEDLQVNTLSCVKRLAEFMGCPFTVEEESQGLVQQVVDLCSFQCLSNMEVNKSKQSFSSWPIKIEHNAFFRKGKIGDSENYLTTEMIAQLDEITEKKFGGFGISFSTSSP